MINQAFVSANIQDVEEIRFLKHTYAALADACSSSDGARHGAEMASLFIEGGVWEAPPEHGGRHVGRTAIATFFSGLGQWALWANHLMVNERITVQGDTAKGLWKNIVPATLIVDGRASPFWIFGGYRDDYVKKDGRWYFQKLDAYVEQIARHDQGWLVK
jgi:hypothetical protein